MSNLTKSLPIVAKIMGDKYGVRVVIGEHDACTDGKVIYLPALPADDDKAAVLVRGYIDHEAAHVRYTEGGLVGSPIERSLQNILEDIRIERRMGKAFPGCVGNLDRLATTLVADGMFERLSDDAHPGAVLQGYLLHRMRHDVLGQSAMRDLADHSESLFHKVFSKGKATRISAIAWEAENAGSTQEVKDLVSRILESLQQDDEDDHQDADDSQGDPQQGSDESQDQQSDDQGSSPQQQGADDPDDEDDGQGASSQPSSPDDSDDDQADDTMASGQDSQQSESGSGGQDKEQAVKRALSASDEDLADDLAQQVARMIEEQSGDAPFESLVQVAEDRDANIRSFGVINAKEALRATNALRSRLDGLIQSSKQQRNPPRRTGRRLDTQSLARLGCGNMRVFRSTAERKAVNTSVHVLLDRSGSMNRLMPLACSAVYATAVALEGISGVNLETAAFPVDGHHVKTLTRFGDRVRMEDYEIGSYGSTPLAEALWRVSHSLLAQKQPRKIALVITDGDPDEHASTVDVIARMEAEGIETIGIGIGLNARENLFPRNRKIHTVDELPKALFELLEQPLMAHSA